MSCPGERVRSTRPGCQPLPGMPNLSELVSAGKLEDDYVVTKHLGARASSEVKLASRGTVG